MADLSQITALCADTFQHEMALIACERMLQHGFAEVVLFTDEGVDAHRDKVPAGLRIERIAPLRSREAYSDFALKGFHPHVHTSHALIFQWDGFVLDAGAWRQDFLAYDYIGAPWPRMLRTAPDRAVGNGGFSLRSARLMRTVAGLRFDAGIMPEDQIIVSLLGDVLGRDSGLRFAPLEVARDFAVETGSIPKYRRSEPEVTPRGSTFGFHGFFNFHLAFDDAALARVFELCMRHPAHRALLCRYHAGQLIANLINSGRVALAMQLGARVCESLGLDADRTTLKEILTEHLVAQPPG